jgi:hypothetical protein
MMLVAAFCCRCKDDMHQLQAAAWSLVDAGGVGVGT